MRHFCTAFQSAEYTVVKSPQEGHAHEFAVQPQEQSASIRKEEKNEMNAEIV